MFMKWVRIHRPQAAPAFFDEPEAGRQPVNAATLTAYIEYVGKGEVLKGGYYFDGDKPHVRCVRACAVVALGRTPRERRVVRHGRGGWCSAGEEGGVVVLCRTNCVSAGFHNSNSNSNSNSNRGETHTCFSGLLPYGYATVE